MKINRILLNCRRNTALGGEMGADPVLLFFRSPVAYMDGGTWKQTTKASAALLTSGYKQSFRPVNGKSLRYDLVSFKTSAADRQYINSMNLVQDMPVELKDDFVIASALRSMRSQSMHRGKHFSEFMELSMRIIFIAMSDITDDSQNIVYQANTKVFTIHDKTDVTDASGRQVAHIERKLLSFHERHYIDMADGVSFELSNEIFHIIKDITNIEGLSWQLRGNILGLNFELFDQYGNIVAVIGQKMLSIHDKYCIDIYQADKDQIVVAIVVALQQMIRDREAASSSSSSSSN